MRDRRVRPTIALLLLLAGGAAEGAGAQTRRLRASDVDTLPATAAERIPYGPDSLQFGELRLPPGRGPFPVAVVIHGGCWLSRYASLRNGAALASALTARGVATWNVEYRRYDHPGGGWPGTFRDAGEATDALRALARRFPLDTTRIVAVGHSAGATLALWLPTRARLAPDSPLRPAAPMAVHGVVAVGGIVDLGEFYTRERRSCGNPAVESVLGGVPDSVPDRLRAVSASLRLPLGVPHHHVAGEFDAIAPRGALEAFAAAARDAGDSVTVTLVPEEGHFEAMAPPRAGALLVVERVLSLLARANRGQAPRRVPEAGTAPTVTRDAFTGPRDGSKLPVGPVATASRHGASRPGIRSTVHPSPTPP